MNRLRSCSNQQDKNKLVISDLKYKKYGTGKEVIITSFLTANPKRFISLLAKDFTVYDISLRRKGFPPQLDGKQKNIVLMTWAEDIYQFALSLKIKRFFYMGISHGGLVGWNLALLHPQCLKGLISVSGVPQGRKSSRLRLQDADSMATDVALDRLLVSTTDLHRRKKIITRVKAELDSINGVPNPGLIWPDCKTDQELASKLKKIQVPILIIQGIQDNTNIVDIPFIATKSVPGAKSVYFQDEGHLIATENPTRVVDEIKLFIKQRQGVL